jgi:hypothetical protein
MTNVYSRYRDLKREIRSSAAVDIQRIIRGFLCRAALKRRRLNRNSSQTHMRDPSASIESVASAAIGAAMGSATPSADATAWRVLRGNTGAGSAEDKSNSASLPALSADDDEMCKKYKDLMLQKKTLKRKLKRFDEEFYSKNGRLPKKADKEARSLNLRCQF